MKRISSNGTYVLFRCPDETCNKEIQVERISCISCGRSNTIPHAVVSRLEEVV